MVSFSSFALKKTAKWITIAAVVAQHIVTLGIAINLPPLIKAITFRRSVFSNATDVFHQLL